MYQEAPRWAPLKLIELQERTGSFAFPLPVSWPTGQQLKYHDCTSEVRSRSFSENAYHGMRVSGHVPAFMTAQQFVEDGADEIQHMNFIFLNFMFDTVKDTRGRLRFTEIAAHAAEIDPASPSVQDFIRFLQQHKTVLDPTLTIFEGMCTDRPGTVSASYAAVAVRMPAQIRRQFFYGGLEVPDGMGRNPRSEGSATGYSRRRPHHETRSGIGMDHPWKIGRRDLGGRGSEHPYQRHPPRHYDSKKRRGLPDFCAVPGARGQNHSSPRRAYQLGSPMKPV